MGVLVPPLHWLKTRLLPWEGHRAVRGPQQEVAGLQGVCLLSGLRLRLHCRDHHAPGLDRTPPPTAPHTRLCHGGRGSLGASSAVLLVWECSRNPHSTRSSLGRGDMQHLSGIARESPSRALPQTRFCPSPRHTGAAHLLLSCSFAQGDKQDPQPLPALASGPCPQRTGQVLATSSGVKGLHGPLPAPAPSPTCPSAQ